MELVDNEINIYKNKYMKMNAQNIQKGKKKEC